MKPKMLSGSLRMLFIGVALISGGACLYGACVKRYHYTDTYGWKLTNGDTRCKHWIEEAMCIDVFTSDADEGNPVEEPDYQISYQTGYGDACQPACPLSLFPQDATNFIPYSGVLSSGTNDYVHCEGD